MDVRFHKEVSIPVGKVTVQGELIIPLKAMAIVIFSHSSGSSRFSKRNKMMKKILHERDFWNTVV